MPIRFTKLFVLGIGRSQGKCWCGHVLFNKDCFLYGSSANINAMCYGHEFGIYLLLHAKYVWNRRCSYIFEKVFVSEDILLLRIRDEFRLRLVVDLKRWSRDISLRKFGQRGKVLFQLLGKTSSLT